MKKTQRYLLILIGLGLMVLSSCKKKDSLGPNVSGVYGPVTIINTLTKSADNIQFANGEKVYFISSFANDASWKLTLTGRTSGAVKTFSGISRNIDAYNTTWEGTANTVPSFTAEIVDVVLTFPYSVNDTLRTTVTVVSKRNADANAVLISNFNISKVTSAGATTGWPSDWPTTTNANTAYGFPDGTKYMFHQGNPWQGGNPSNSPYVDFITYKAPFCDTNWGTYFPLYADPARVYFNVMVYNTGTANTWLKIVFFEEGGSARYVDIKGINWTGWKLLSYNYLNNTSTDNTAIPPKPNKITAVQFVLLSSRPGPVWPSTDVVSTAYDHPIFTHDRPYQP